MIFVRALGAAQIEAGESQVTPQSMRKFALLLHLSAERGRRVSRGTLQDLMYPGLTLERASHALRELAYQLRQSGVEVETDKHGWQLSAEAVRSDYSEVIERERPDEAQLRAVEGGFLPGYAPSHSEAYQEWFEGWKARTTFEVVKALLKELQRARAAADVGRMEKVARACLALEPLHEEATLALAEAMALSGAKAKAVGLLDAYIAELGERSALRIPANVLKRRISERIPDGYRSTSHLPFVGRGDLMQRIGNSLIDAREGRARAVVLIGEAGIGKSRVAAEFCSVAELTGARTIKYLGQPGDEQRPLAAFAEIVPALFQLPGALGCAPSSIDALAPLIHPSSVQRDFEGHQDASVVAQRVADAIHDLVDAVCAEQPVILLFEDAHWIDRTSISILLTLCAHRRHRRLLGILTTRRRDVVRDAAIIGETVTILRLHRLDRETTRQLAEAGLRSVGMEADEDIRNWVAVASAGNPLFLASLLSHLKATGDCKSVPTDIEQLLNARVAMASNDARLVLECIVALGKHSSVRRLTEVLDLPSHTVIQAASELEEDALIEGSGEFVRTAHPLIAEVIRTGAREVANALLHRRIALTLQGDAEQQPSGQLLWDCAEHWARAGDSQMAYRAFIDCGSHALSIGRAREASETYLRAAELSPDPESRRDALRRATQAARTGGEHDLVLRSLELIGDRTVVHDDLEVSELTARVLVFGPREDLANRSLSCLASDASDEHRGRVALALLKYADMYGRRDLANTAFECIRALPHLSIPTLVRLEAEMVFECSFGSPQLGLEIAHRIARDAETLAPGARATIELNAAYALWQGGDANAGVTLLRRAYEHAQAAGLRRSAIIAALHLSELLQDLYADEESKSWLRRALDIASQSAEAVGLYEIATVCVSDAFARQDLAEAQRWYRMAQSQGLYDRGDIRQRFDRAFRVRMRQMRRRNPLTDRELEGIDEAFVRDDIFSGVRDLEVAIATYEGVARGAADTALNRAMQYIEHNRRTRSRLPRILADAIATARQATRVDPP